MQQGKKPSFVLSHSESLQYFAFGLEALLSRSAVGGSQEEYQADFRCRHFAFLNSLLNSGDEANTYEIRIISNPHADLYTRGRISIAFLCRMDECSVIEADCFRSQTGHLLNATYPEFEFRVLPNEEISATLRPFEVKELVEIRRRLGHEPLDSLAGTNPSRKIGFSGKAEAVRNRGASKAVPAGSVLHLYPFVHSWTDLRLIAKLMLLEAHPIAVSFRLRPTCLDSGEEGFLSAQIAACEKAIQGGSAFPALRLQAQIYERFQSERLFGLRDNAALGLIEIGSPAAIPNSVIDSIGSYLTEPAGWTGSRREAGLESYFAGGYDILHKSKTEDLESFRQIQFALDQEGRSSGGEGRLPYLFDSMEAASFFRLPWATNDPPVGLPSLSWRSLPPPDNLPEKGCRLGIADRRCPAQTVWVGPEDRKSHIYVVGQTGTGKTTLLKSMILEDIRGGEGICLLDPHGDLYKEVLGNIPEDRADDVVLIDPTDAEFPVALNMLENQSLDQRYFLAQEFVGIIRRLMHDDYGQETQMIGPVFFQHMRMNLLLAMSNPKDPGTLLEFYNIFQSEGYWKRWLPLKIHDPILERWVRTSLPRYDYTKPGSEGESMGGYVASKFQGFIFDPLLRSVFGQKRTLVNFRTIMDEGKILLVNLAKGELTEENSRFLGMIFLAKLMAAAMGRVSIPKEKRRQFNLYVDEFQSMATGSFVTLLSESRKFGLNLVLANQFLTQVKDPKILQAVFGNVATTISFRLGHEDAEMLERKFLPTFNKSDLINIPNWNAYISTQINGQVVRPFSFQTVLTPEEDGAGRVEAVRSLSRLRYARPKAEVEKEIEASLEQKAKATDESMDLFSEELKMTDEKKKDEKD